MSDSSDKVPCPDAFWLDGCSWGCGYYSGLMQGMKDRWGSEIYQKRWGGASAGALFALGMALGRPVEEFVTLYRQFARQGSAYGVFLKMSIYHDAVMRHWLFVSETQPIDISVLNGKLFVGITAFPCELVLKSNFLDVYDLMDTLHASFHIPWYCSHIEPVIMPKVSNDQQTLMHRDEKLFATSKDHARLSKWYIDGGIARNCDIKLCCPGVTLNVSPVLQLRLTLMDCVFPMTMDRFSEIQKSSRLDVLEFTSEDHFDFAPASAPASARAEGKNNALSGTPTMSRNPSVASLSLSRSASAADIHDEKHKHGALTVSNSFNRLTELATAAANKLRPSRSRSSSTVLARSQQNRMIITFVHSRAVGVGRYMLALTLWGCRLMEYMVYKQSGKLTFCLVLGFLWKHFLGMRKRAGKRS